MARKSIEEKIASARNRKIRHMVYTAARKCHDMDFAAGCPAHLHHDYLQDATLRAIVAELFADPNVRNIDIPRKAVKLYIDAYEPATM